MLKKKKKKQPQRFDFFITFPAFRSNITIFIWIFIVFFYSTFNRIAIVSLYPRRHILKRENED